MKNSKIVIIRGAGDFATGIIQTFWRAGYQVLALELAAPLTIRRSVALSEAVYKGSFRVEDMTGRLVHGTHEAVKCWEKNEIPLLVDPSARAIELFKPAVVIDAVMAKRNLGLYKNMAACVVAVGPGFQAGADCHAIVDTAHGQNFGRLIYTGQLEWDANQAAVAADAVKEKVIYSPSFGLFRAYKKIGDEVAVGEVIASAGKARVTAHAEGILYGIVHDGVEVFKGMKVASINPIYQEKSDCYTVSEQARSLGEAVLAAVLSLTAIKE